MAYFMCVLFFSLSSSSLCWFVFVERIISIAIWPRAISILSTFHMANWYSTFIHIGGMPLLFWYVSRLIWRLRDVSELCVCVCVVCWLPKWKWIKSTLLVHCLLFKGISIKAKSHHVCISKTTTYFRCDLIAFGHALDPRHNGMVIIVAVRYTFCVVWCCMNHWMRYLLNGDREPHELYHIYGEQQVCADFSLSPQVCISCFIRNVL